jgi:hypothetical protein
MPHIPNSINPFLYLPFGLYLFISPSLLNILFLHQNYFINRFVLPITLDARLGYELSSPAQTFGTWVRILFGTWMSVCLFYLLSCV